MSPPIEHDEDGRPFTMYPDCWTGVVLVDCFYDVRVKLPLLQLVRRVRESLHASGRFGHPVQGDIDGVTVRLRLEIPLGPEDRCRDAQAARHLACAIARERHKDLTDLPALVDVQAVEVI